MTVKNDNEPRYQAMFSENRAVMLFIDPNDGTIRDASVGACQYYGYSLPEITEMNISDINTLSISEISSAMQHAKRGSKNYFEFQHRLASGEIRDVEVYSNPIILGEHKLLYSVVHDITERKHAEEALLKSEQKNRAIIETSKDWIWEINLDGRHTYSNPAVKKILGYTPEEINVSNTFDLIHDDDKQRVRLCLENSTHNEEGWNNLVIRWRHKDGSYRYLESNAVPRFNADKRMIGFIGVDRDVTERMRAEEALHESEEKYRLAMEATQDGLWDWDTITANVYYSPSWNSILGEAHVRNDFSTWESRIHPDDKVRITNALNAHLEGETKIWQEEHRLRKADGSWVWVLGRGQIVEKDGKGKPLRMVGTMTDISERKQAEVEKERLQKQLTQSQKIETIGQLTGGVAHDFNNLLGIINGYAELAYSQHGDDKDIKVKKYLETIINAGDRATKLISQMLLYSRIEHTGNVPLKISSALKEDITMLRSTLPSSIEIESKIDTHLPYVLIDPIHLDQILMNLSINARDAMDGVGKLTIQLRRAFGLDTNSPVTHKPIRGDWVELSVSDTGSGVNPEIANKMFDPYYTTKGVGKGSGMGLSIIFRIMENLNGHILFESEVGKGSTFRLLFPPLAEDASNYPESIKEADAAPKGDGSEILVVDDEPMLSEQLAEILIMGGYQPHIMTDSTEALELFQKDPNRFSIIITDQTMPKMLGTELIARLKEIRPELPVIICSGYSDKIDAEEAAKINIAYLQKPINIHKLLLEISSQLGLNNKDDSK